MANVIIVTPRKRRNKADEGRTISINESLENNSNLQETQKEEQIENPEEIEIEYRT